MIVLQQEQKDLECTGNSALLLSAVSLLKAGEQIPQSVYEIIWYCHEKNLPLRLSRNEPAGSCLDASRKRVQSNGHTGIALRDELKTLVGTFVDSEKRRHVIAVHCRGDRSVDFKKVSRLLPEYTGKKLHVSLLDEHSMWKMYCMRYGIANPVLLDTRSDYGMLQVFDTGLLDGPSPCMMMTNAGEHTWGMEFDVAKLVGAVDYHILGSICK